MNLRSVDLNLLVALDALLSERHVTKASDKVGLSQPAMSNALSRLRGMFADELLVRTATGMKPTPRALELVDPLRQLLRQVERVLESDSGFDAATTQRTFTVRMSDILACLLLPQLVARGRTSPGIGFNVLHLPPGQTVDALERDEIDLAVSMGLDHSNAIRSEKLLLDRMVCIMRSGHPIAKKAIAFEDFISQEHMKVSMSPTDLRFVDDVLGELGHQRKIVLNVPHWLVVPHVLKQTDLLAVMPGHLAATLMDAELRMFDVPFKSKPFSWMMYWHRRYDQSNANRWLREHIRQVCAALD
ncbi:LysR family transcriptional regulator [Bradyrhizobium sp. NAS80.1]|uniref:LysR family transcriptional regulator n=1 Tax=Bradyrhizobium sp. NAS80.1 TaxID=1680159 RepID=UPI0009652BDC|nr:LysR family transcriptional regulator [Bradyrhizobium sp. NAS80.1]OKO91511.1 LysR family transcriptional regulator [Bradyrhizobium sp. NAS80.1]